MIKRFFLVSFFWALFLSISFSQSNKLVLDGKPKLLPNEIVARKDINERYCAAIAVLSDKEGFRYDSNMGIVGKVDDMPGKDIVYLTPDEQVLEIYLAGFEPLRLILHDIGIRLNPKEMWQIRIKALASTKLDSVPVAIESKPRYDEIFIDGQKHGPGPIHTLVPGTHIIKIALPNYKTVIDTIKIDKNHLKFEYTLKEQEYTQLKINSVPDGAQVYLDDVYVDKTPIVNLYPVGKYTLKIEKKGYQRIEQPIVLKKPRTSKNFKLEKLMAYLQINTYDYARISVDGQIIPANKKVSFSPKYVRVKIYLAGKDSLERSIALNPNKTQKIEFYPKFSSGEVQASADPVNAIISLFDSKRKLVASDTSQLIVRKIPVGPYFLSVHAPGYVDDKETIVITPNGVVKRFVSLKPAESSTSKVQAKKQNASSSIKENRPWRAIVFLNTFPKEPGTAYHQWTWNPAAIQSGFLINGGAIYENYNLTHETSWRTLQKKMKVINQTFYGGVFLGNGALRVAFNYAKRIKLTKESLRSENNHVQAPGSFKEISEIISPTLGVHFTFGLNLAVRGNFRNKENIERFGIENKKIKKITTIDAGLQQNLGDILYINIFANHIKEYLDGKELKMEKSPKYINADATLRLNNLWLNGGAQLSNLEVGKDSLFYLRATLNLNKTLWVNGFYAQSHRYYIVDMDVNLPAPVTMMGGGFHLYLNGLVVGYEATYLKFSKVSPITANVQANLIDRDHLRHEITISLTL